MDLDRSPDQLIKVGLAALKQKNYERAIATFQQLRQTDGISNSHRLKSQMGLIRTYEAQGANAQAQELCRPLLKSRSQTIRQWAHDKLQQLIADAKAISPEQSSPPSDAIRGFIPETSGFTPFNSNKSASEQAPLPDFSGPSNTVLNNEATPIDPQNYADKTITDSSFVNQTSDPDRQPLQPLSKEIQSIENFTVPSESEPSSLFHYQTLNRRETAGTKKSSDIESPDNNEPSVATTGKHSQSPSESQSQFNDDKQQDTQPKHFNLLSSTSGPATWPKGERLSTLKSLGKVGMGRLWFAQLTSIPILFLIVRWLVKTTLAFIGSYLEFLKQLSPITLRISNFFWEPQYWSVLISLGVLTIAVPWLWPWLLRPTDQISSAKLQTYSPEAEQLLRRLCIKRRWHFPKIQRLTSDLPLIFSYGWRPRFGQLVVSQGLLDLLEPDELAALIMYEISHWSSLDWIFFSTHGLLLQGCHRAYWFFARRGKNRSIMIQIGAGILATLSYVVFWLLAQLGYGLARTRIPHRDRIAAELTGNPNGLIRGLAKISAAMADAIDHQGYTPPLLESLATLLPVNPQRAGTSAQDYAWGAFNPLRHWLSINQAHPPLGDRLHILSTYGRHWQLKPSLNFAQLRLKTGSRSLSIQDWQALLLQGGAWSGLIIGLGIAIIMWLIGAIATNLEFPLLDWLYQDRSILIGIPLICAATGQLLRINSFFSEITSVKPTSQRQLLAWQTDHRLIPLSNHPITINGTLTGRPALANWLGQEWRLQTNQGSIKLHHTSYLGPLSNIKGLAPWLNESLQITGWFRRGHHLWIDIEHCTRQNQTKFSQHPTWSVTISLILLVFGLWLILRGG